MVYLLGIMLFLLQGLNNAVLQYCSITTVWLIVYYILGFSPRLICVYNQKWLWADKTPFWPWLHSFLTMTPLDLLSCESMLCMGAHLSKMGFYCVPMTLRIKVLLELTVSLTHQSSYSLLEWTCTWYYWHISSMDTHLILMDDLCQWLHVNINLESGSCQILSNIS